MSLAASGARPSWSDHRCGRSDQDAILRDQLSDSFYRLSEYGLICARMAATPSRPDAQQIVSGHAKKPKARANYDIKEKLADFHLNGEHRSSC